MLCIIIIIIVFITKHISQSILLLEWNAVKSQKVVKKKNSQEVVAYQARSSARTKPVRLLHNQPLELNE